MKLVEGSGLRLTSNVLIRNNKETKWLLKRMIGKSYHQYVMYFSNSRKVRKLLKKAKALL